MIAPAEKLFDRSINVGSPASYCAEAWLLQGIKAERT